MQCICVHIARCFSTYKKNETKDKLQSFTVIVGKLASVLRTGVVRPISSLQETKPSPHRRDCNRPRSISHIFAEFRSWLLFYVTGAGPHMPTLCLFTAVCGRGATIHKSKLREAGGKRAPLVGPPTAPAPAAAIPGGAARRWPGTHRTSSRCAACTATSPAATPSPPAGRHAALARPPWQSGPGVFQRPSCPLLQELLRNLCRIPIHEFQKKHRTASGVFGITKEPDFCLVIKLGHCKCWWVSASLRCARPKIRWFEGKNSRRS